MYRAGNKLKKRYQQEDQCSINQLRIKNMRKLSVKQKKLLMEWHNISVQGRIGSWNDLSQEQIEKLEKINDSEILYQEVNRFLGDYISDRYDY